LLAVVISASLPLMKSPIEYHDESFAEPHLPISGMLT
jgi:hypothetical protein